MATKRKSRSPRKRKAAPRRKPLAKRAKKHGTSPAKYSAYLKARRALAKKMLG